MTLTFADLTSPSARTLQESTMASDASHNERTASRTFTREYKLRIVAEYETATTPGAKGALLRREGLYQSNIRKWREARDAGRLAARKDDQIAGRRKNTHTMSADIKRLQEENKRLTSELEKSRAVVDILGKTCALLEIHSKSAE